MTNWWLCMKAFMYIYVEIVKKVMISLWAMTDTSILHYESIIMKFLTLCNILTKKLDTLHYSTKPNCTVYIVFFPIDL